MNPQAIRKLYRDQRGANMVEYIILVGVVAIFAIIAFKAFGGNISQKISQQGTTVDGVQGTTP